MKEFISTDKAPEAIGPYSQGIVFKDMIFTSGQISIDPKSQKFNNSNIEDQTRQVLDNLGEVLKAGGSSLEKVIKTTIFLKNMKDFTKVNTIYSEYFKSKPARSTVEVARLPKDALVEIEAIAYK